MVILCDGGYGATPFLFGFGRLGAGLVAKLKFKFLVARGGFLRGGRCASF